MEELLRRLSNARGVAGYEDEVREIMVEEMKKRCSEVEVDKFGNVIGKIGRGNPKIMIAAHMDEVGFVVKHIDDKGFLRFINIGGLDARILPASRVCVLSEKGNFPGVIGIKPPHLLDEEAKKQAVKEDELYIDVGMDKETAEKSIQIGDPIVFDSEFTTLGNKTVMGKAFDDRAGCCAMLKILEKLENAEGTIYAVATCQEELGLKGARTAAFRIEPDYALVLDVGIAGDTPDIKETESVVKIGAGPCITVIEAGGRGMVPSPKIKKHLIETAKENSIPYQLDAWKQGMTDAAVIYMSKEGIPTGGLSIPCRYLHGPLSILSMEDLENTIRLGTLAIEKWGRVH